MYLGIPVNEKVYLNEMTKLVKPYDSCCGRAAYVCDYLGGMYIPTLSQHQCPSDTIR
jgi:hypothetical protein